VGELAGVDLMNMVGSILLAVGIAIYIYLLLAVSRQSAQPLPFRFMVLAALFLLMGDLFSLRGSPVGNINFTLFLLGFPILTILGERVELSRFLAPAVYRRGEWGLWAVLLAFLLLLVQDGRLLVALWAVLMALATLPLMGSELALVRVGQTSPQKLHRYLGQHLLLAYSWFFLGLVLVIVWAAVRGGSALYDASVHSLAVGFVGTMILAHAPVIAPAILPRTIAQEKLNLLPLVLLTVGNLLRVGGYILKGAELEELVEAVQAVARGETYIFPSLMPKLVGDYLHRVQSGETEPDELKRLTPREQEVLRLIGEGRTTNEIANALTLSPHTVRRHRDNIMQKLNLHSKAELIRFAVRKGLLDELE